jgi:hypothetical protein
MRPQAVPGAPIDGRKVPAHGDPVVSRGVLRRDGPAEDVAQHVFRIALRRVAAPAATRVLGLNIVAGHDEVRRHVPAAMAETSVPDHQVQRIAGVPATSEDG